MAGTMDPVLERDQRQYGHVGYGTFVLAVDIPRFVPVADFLRGYPLQPGESLIHPPLEEAP